MKIRRVKDIQCYLCDFVFESTYINMLINLNQNKEILAQLFQDLSFTSKLQGNMKKMKNKKKGVKIEKFFTHKEDHKDDRQLHLLTDCSVIPVDANIGPHAKIPEQHNPNRVAADLLSNTGKTICRQIFVLTGQKNTC